MFDDSDILCCTETWLSPIIIDSLLAIPGKTIFRRDRGTRGGGVCIYVDNKLSPFCKVDVQSSYVSPDLEIISLDIKKTGLKFMKVLSIYRPPRGNHKKCIDKLTEILSRRDNFKKEVWLLGDFNVDYLKRGDPNLKRLINLFKIFGLTQYIFDITRPGVHSGSCIDWIVTNCRFFKSANVSNIYISDHYAFECTRKKARECNNTVLRNVRTYKNYDKDILISLLHARLSHTNFENEVDPNTKWELLYNTLSDI